MSFHLRPPQLLSRVKALEWIVSMFQVKLHWALYEFTWTLCVKKTECLEESEEIKKHALSQILSLCSGSRSATVLLCCCVKQIVETEITCVIDTHIAILVLLAIQMASAFSGTLIPSFIWPSRRGVMCIGSRKLLMLPPFASAFILQTAGLKLLSVSLYCCKTCLSLLIKLFTHCNQCASITNPR